VFWQRERATLEDVVEVLNGIATILMKIDAKLDVLVDDDEEEDDEEAQP